MLDRNTIEERFAPSWATAKEEAESWIPKVMGNGRNKKIILILPNIFQYLVWVIEGPSANKLLPKAILRLFGRDTIGHLHDSVIDYNYQNPSVFSFQIQIRVIVT